MVKRTDLLGLFGRGKTLYRRVNGSRPELVQGVKSDKLKFSQVICKRCNGEVAQPHDASWDRLSRFLRERAAAITPGNPVRVRAAFPGSARDGLLGVHLFFCRMTGCLIKHGGAPIDTTSLANAVLSGNADPHLYLTFLLADARLSRHAHISPLMTSFGTSAQWFYFVGRIGVHVVYSPHLGIGRPASMWHPSSTSRWLTFEDFSLAGR
jgi:hypothetical protein